MSSVGWATLEIIPSLRGLRSELDKQVGGDLARSGRAIGSQFGDEIGRSAGSRFGSTFKKAAKVGLVGFGGLSVAAGAFIKDAVQLEAQYGRTMSQIRVATGASADSLERLDDLAIRLGKDTIFSANEASEAMLELAKNGIKPAIIEAGALDSALTLAAAGGVDMEQAATTMGNALNAFRLKGRQSGEVAAALAGAANASSASVGSLAEGMQQASAGAADAGLSVQETTGLLAAFANAGISGSDAGTSLKTTLARLVPQTNKAAKMMDELGLSFVKRNGEFKSASEIAEQLQVALGDLTAEERATALNTIFGSDARRAATVLMNEGGEGIKKYIRATSDLGAAEKMAKANMEGTAGAIERLEGAWETTKLEFGKAIAPVAADFMEGLAGSLDGLAPKLASFGTWFADEGAPALKRFGRFGKNEVLPVLQDVGSFAKDAAGFAMDLVEALNDLPKPAKYAALVAALGGGAALKLRGGGGGALGTAGRALGIAKPIPVFVTNPGFGGGGGGGPVPVGGGGPDKAPKGKLSAVGGRFVRSIPLIGTLAITFDVAKDVAERPGNDAVGGILGTKGLEGLHKHAAKQASASFEDVDRKVTESKAHLASFGDSLDLVGNKKVNPALSVPTLPQWRERLDRFYELEIDAGRPIEPNLKLFGYDVAMDKLYKLQRLKIGDKTVNIHTKYVDPGEVDFLSGGVSGARANGGQVLPRRSYLVGERGPEIFRPDGAGSIVPNHELAKAGAGVQVNIGTVVAQDYRDLMRQVQRRAQKASIGGFGG